MVEEDYTWKEVIEYFQEMIDELTYEYGEFPNEVTLAAIRYWEEMKATYENGY